MLLISLLRDFRFIRIFLQNPSSFSLFPSAMESGQVRRGPGFEQDLNDVCVSVMSCVKERCHALRGEKGGGKGENIKFRF